ncbi:hypothetical protein CAG70_02940 [Photobacterium halotolerans]|uniref:Lipoprotein n=1 Tax=Photobacterium halotolerans TaxID=265726 RepID=A0A7X4XVB6_9GAMM|nr:hypothetical protein [Photobacterium halotolerans]NAW65915.1 hypothetical protein [Photobacterium halotolerans]NAX45958.1 hypothetical protein [Photobacterium halotolerans]
MRFWKFLLMLASLSLVGCGSTPYQDDYARHINNLPNGIISDSVFQFSFEGATLVDMRGKYQPDDSVDPTQIMYHGGAGVIGLLAQVGTYSALIQSQRTEKLLQEQEKANETILPLIELTKNIPLGNLVGEYGSHYSQTETPNAQTIRVKPIFFSNREMNKLSLKSIVWLPNEGYTDIRYKNLIQVYGPHLDESQRESILNGDQAQLADVLSSMLKGTIYIIRNELAGKYASAKSNQETFLFKNETGVKAIRGTVVEEKCGYQIIKDIRSWYIAYPKPETAMKNFSTKC